MANYKKAYDENHNPIYLRKATMDDKIEWKPVPEESISPADMKKLGTHQPGQRRDQFAALKNIYGKKRARELMERGDGAAERAELTTDMPWWKQAAVSGARETDKLATGVADLGDFLGYALDPGAGGSPTNAMIHALGNKAIERKVNRGYEEKEKDRIFREFEEERAGSAALAGSSVPYVLSGLGAGPTTKKIAGEVIDTAEDAAVRAVAEGRGAIHKGSTWWANQPGAVGRAGRRARKETFGPRERKVRGKKAQYKEIDREREGMGSQILGDVGLGMVEGGLHPDMNAWEGGLASGAGSSTGAFLRPRVSRAKSRYRPQEQELVAWGEERGMKFLPGMALGNTGHQKFEHGLRGSKEYSDAVRDIDVNNEKVFNREARKSMGIAEDIDELTPEVLSKHMKDLEKRYTDLEAKTVGRFAPEAFDEMGQIIATLSTNKSKNGKRAFKDVSSYFERMRKMSNTKRDRRGRFQQATFNGAEFKQIRKDLRAEITSAYKRDDMISYNALKPMLDQIDQALEIGVRDAGGEVSAQVWKKLNENYALTDLVINHGMTPTNMFDPGRLLNHLMSTDTKRLMMETGGDIKNLQNMAKLEYMNKGQLGSDLSGHGIETNAGSMTPFQGFIESSNPVEMALSMPKRAYLNMYKRGWPARTGYLGLSGKDTGDIMKYTRAGSQASQVHPKLVTGAMNSYDFAKKQLEGMGTSLADWLDLEED